MDHRLEASKLLPKENPQIIGFEAIKMHDKIHGERIPYISEDYFDLYISKGYDIYVCNECNSRRTVYLKAYKEVLQ